MNNTFDCSKAPNLRITRQLIQLDQEFHVKWKHIAGIDNTGADGLSRHETIAEVPKDVKMKLYECNSLDRETNEVFPVDMKYIQKHQEEDPKLRSLIASGKYAFHQTPISESHLRSMIKLKYAELD